MSDEPGALRESELAEIRGYVERCIRGDLFARVELGKRGVEYLAKLLGEVDRVRDREREAEA
jgi:hypothetical protein